MILIQSNPETFFDALCRYLTPGKKWRHNANGEILFGDGDFWLAKIIESDHGPAALLLCLPEDNYDEEDIETIEQAICLLEGFDSAPTPSHDS